MALDPFTWVLCDQTGRALSGGHVAQNRRLVAQRNHAMEARLTLSLHDQVAVELFRVLQNGIPQLRVYLGTVLVFAGYWTPMRGSNTIDSQSTLELVFKDAFDRLSSRFTAASFVATATDAGFVASALVLIANGEGQTGVITDPGFIELTKVRDRTYSYKNIAEAITELTEVIDGFDWFPVYIDPRSDSLGRTMEFHVARQLGTRRENARFEFGAGTLENCAGYSFTTGLPVNSVFAVGSGIVEEAADAESIAKYGTYETSVSATDVSETLTLSDKAFDALRPSPLHIMEFRPDPTIAPLPWRDFWLGDTIFLNIDDGAFQIQYEARVQTIEVGIDDSDNVSDLVVTIDPGGNNSYLPPADSARSYVQKQRDILRRLSIMETP